MSLCCSFLNSAAVWRIQSLPLKSVHQSSGEYIVIFSKRTSAYTWKIERESNNIWEFSSYQVGSPNTEFQFLLQGNNFLRVFWQINMARLVLGCHLQSTICPLSHFHTFTFLQVIIGILGLIGNLSCLVYFSLCSIVKRNFHRLMLASAIFDFFYILSAIFLFSTPHLAPKYDWIW